MGPFGRGVIETDLGGESVIWATLVGAYRGIDRELHGRGATHEQSALAKACIACVSTGRKSAASQLGHIDRGRTPPQISLVHLLHLVTPFDSHHVSAPVLAAYKPVMGRHSLADAHPWHGTRRRPLSTRRQRRDHGGSRGTPYCALSEHERMTCYSRCPPWLSQTILSLQPSPSMDLQPIKFFN